MTFRRPREEDYLGSYLRRHVFRHMLRRELTLDTVLGRENGNSDPEAQTLLTDNSNPLPGWQDKDAPHHWQREFTNSIYFAFRADLAALNTGAISPVHRLSSSRSVLNYLSDKLRGCTPFQLPLFCFLSF